MNDKTTQSDKPDAGTGAAPEVVEKPKTVTQLLDEWDAAAKPKAEPKPKGDESANDVPMRLTAVERDLAEKSYKEELSNVIDQLTDGLDIDVPKWIVESWVNEQADDDTRISDLFENRDSRSGHWSKAIAALKPAFQEWASTSFVPTAKPKDSPGNKGIGAAVRAAKDVKVTTGEDDGSDYGNLSDAEFGLKKAEVFRLAKAGQLS